jgi:predicted Zn-dependent protease
MELAVNVSRTPRGLGPFNKSLMPPLLGTAHLGDKVVDERISISADPMDPELGFPPFSLDSEGFVDLFKVPVYHPVKWIDHGVLTHLAYDRNDAIVRMGKNLGLPNSGAFRMSGGDTSIEEMISTTKRGIYVTRFDQLQLLDFTSQLHRGYTRDGLWLIENGKISKAIKNFAFTESILFILNNVDQLGVPQRVFHPNVPDPYLIPQPRIVPPLKVRDFSFTALTDAV